VALINRLVGRRKIRGVTEEELAANPLFTSKSQGAPLQEPPPAPAPPPPPAPPPRTPAPLVHPDPPAAAVSPPPADPAPPPPSVDPTAVADRIVEQIIARVRAPQSVEPSPPDSPAAASATPVTPPLEAAAGPSATGQQAPLASSPPALTPAEQEHQRERGPGALETSAESAPSSGSEDGEPWQLPQWQYKRKRARINQRQKRK
jgi:hypothetical protein